MTARCLLVRDGLDGAIPAIAVALRDAHIDCEVVARHEVGQARPSEAVLLQIPELDAIATCWEVHRQGHRSLIALSERPSSEECIRLLNAGADYYLDAWAPLPELVARVRIALRRPPISPFREWQSSPRCHSRLVPEGLAWPQRAFGVRSSAGEVSDRSRAASVRGRALRG